MKSKQKQLSGDEALEDYLRALLDVSCEDDQSGHIELLPEEKAFPPAEISVVPHAESVADTQPEVRVENKPILTAYLDQEPQEKKSLRTEKLERLFDQAQQAKDSSAVTRAKPATTDVVALQHKPSIQITKEETVSAVKVEALVERKVVTSTQVKPDVKIETVTQADAEVVVDSQPRVEIATPSITESRVIEQGERASTVDDVSSSVMEATQPKQADFWDNHSYQDSEFPVLYFNVNRVTFAVPLAELGGIHQIQELTHMIGRSSWYLGLQSGRTKNIDVIDTAKLVMPEKLLDDSHTKEYQYIVVLGDSKWGLAGDKLLGTEVLSADKVRWRESAGRRPWLAGMVKEKMCALIHVNAMVRMLNQGLNIDGNN